MDYTLEFLENKFKEHSKKYIEECKIIKKNRKERGEQDDSYQYEDFNLPLAFVSIIQEIRKIKGG